MNNVSILPPTGTPLPPAQGWQARTYSYDGAQPHAVSAVNREQGVESSYTYDANGNMTCRVENGVTWKQDYNTENRISAIHKMNGDCTTGTILESWLYGYDGDGVRVSTAHFTGGTADSLSLYFFGGNYEVTDGAVKKYYSFAGQSIAMKDDAGLKYFLTDHLGSVVAVSGADGALLEQQRYLPFGAVRSDYSTIGLTDYGYTGQRSLPDTGLIDYKARFYSAYLNRFLQPDTLIPSADTPQTWNRFSYANNSPVLFTDPSGHIPCPWNIADNSCDENDWTAWILNGIYEAFNINTNLYIPTNDGVTNFSGAVTNEYIELVEPAASLIYRSSEISLDLFPINPYTVSRALSGSDLAGNRLSSEERFELGLWGIFGIGLDTGPLVYGPSAGGKLRKFADSVGGITLTDLKKPTELSVLEFSLQTLDDAAKIKHPIYFDLTHMKDLDGVLAGTGKYADTITGQELRYITTNWDRFEDVVTFFRNGKITRIR